MIPITLELLESNATISRDINSAIATHLNKIVRKKISKTELKLKSLVDKWIRTSPEIESLNSEGVAFSLNAQFGLKAGDAPVATEAIIQAVLATISVSISRWDSSNLGGNVTFQIQPDNFANLLSLPDGVVTTELGKTLPWLEWLLTMGNSAIVMDYEYTPSAEGRSGGGTMSGGGIWRVPPEFSGNEANNFITRSLTMNNRDIEKVLQELLVK